MIDKDRVCMSPEHITAIEAALGRAALGANKGKLNILEYGSGFSTIYYANYLYNQGYKLNWTALESDDSWRYTLMVELQDRPLGLRRCIRLPAFGYGSGNGLVDPGFQDRLKNECMDDYICWPINQKSGIKYHVILVDGRKRSRCIQVARESIVEGGTILLHDAQRTYYHKACKGLHIKRVVDSDDEELWVMREKR
jgi:hypothetical protein